MYDIPQRTAIAAADGELHDKPVFDSHHASPDLFISNRSKHRTIQLGLPLKYSGFTTIALPPTAQKS